MLPGRRRTLQSVLSFILGFKHSPCVQRVLPRRLRTPEVRALLHRLGCTCDAEDTARSYVSIPAGSIHMVLMRLRISIDFKANGYTNRHHVTVDARTLWSRARARVLGLVRWYIPRNRQTDRTRCRTCRRKVPVAAPACDCGYVFCSRHRLPTDHHCRVDYRWRHTQLLRQQNPRITVDRVKDRI